MDIAAVQLDCVWENPNASFAKASALLDAAPPTPGSLVVLPEMFATGFSLDLSKTCMGAAREAEEFLRTIARAHRCAVLGGVVSPAGEGSARNEAVVFSPEGTELARYVKQRPFSGGGEDKVHERGTGFALFEWQGMRIAPLICYDLRFPEVFRAAALGGAEMFIVIAAWPSIRIEHWRVLLRARAIENQAFALGVNCTGNVPLYEYNGHTMLVDPHGVIVAEADPAPQVMHACADPSAAREWREKFPSLNDARRWS